MKLTALCITLILGAAIAPPHLVAQSRPGLHFTVELELNAAVYGKTRYKNPPQFAIWIENEESGEMRTLYVTQKMGRGTWNGKPTVPVNVPYWVGKYNEQLGTDGDPTAEHPLPDAITQPTPTTHFQVSADVSEGGQWICFVEVNVSGDFNEAFPSKLPDGSEDRYGNGQPSLVYKAVISAAADELAEFKLVGRTEQMRVVRKLVTDLDDVTTAKQLFKKMALRCQTQHKAGDGK